MSSRLMANVKASFIIIPTGLIITLAYHLLISNNLGAEDYGSFIYSVNTSIIVSLICQLGLQNAAIRFVPEIVVSVKNKLLVKYWVFGLIVIFFMFILVFFIVGIPLLFFGDNLLSDSLVNSIIIGLIISPFLATIRFQKEFLRSLQLIKSALIFDEIFRVSIALLLTLLFWVFHKGIYSSLLAYGCAVVFTAGIYLWNVFSYLKRVIPSIGCVASERFSAPYKLWVTAAIPMVITSVMKELQQRVDTLMLAPLDSMESAGIFGGLFKVGMLSALPFGFFYMASVPYMSELYHKGELKSLQKFVSRSTNIIFIVSSIAAIILIIGKDFFAGMWGGEFIPYSWILAVFGVTNVLVAACGPAAFLLTIAGYERVVAKGLAMGLLLNVGLNFVFIPIIGLPGALVGTVVSLVYWSWWLMLRTKAIVGIASYVRKI